MSPIAVARRRRDPPRLAWLIVGLGFVIGPLVLARAGGWHARRGFVAELGSGLGIVALGVLAYLIVLTARWAVLKRLGADVAIRLHRRLATVLLALVTAHVVAAVAADPTRVALLRFFGEPWRAQAAIGSVAALLLLGATSAARRRLGMPYALWRVVHVSLATAAVILALLHTIGWHRYLMTGVGALALLLVGGSALAAVAGLRVGRHQILRSRPYKVDRVVPERGSAVTVELRAEGHAGHLFSPGQFAWLKLADRRLGVAEHPFSYSSSAEHPERPSFTIRRYKGFSAQAAKLAPGTRILVDGPHGAFRATPNAKGMLLLASGIGITPIISILRTAADRQDRRRFLLVYASRTLPDITFREELEQLSRRLCLRVVHVLSRPSDNWEGARGRVSTDLLDHNLPEDLREWEFFLCGSGPAVDSSLVALSGLGIPVELVHAERFVEV